MAVFLRRLQSVFSECVRLLSSSDVTPETSGYVTSRLQLLEVTIKRAKGSLIDNETGDILLEKITTLRSEALMHCSRSPGGEETAYKAERVKVEGRGGSPSYCISRDQLEFLIECGFTVSQMAHILWVSESTIFRRLRCYSVRREYSSMSDTELDQVVEKCIGGNRQLGANAIHARLVSQGLRLQRIRVRESMVRVDPGGVAKRSLAQKLHRRVYKVAGPNSLWHVDGNHKLIKWKIVIHGGIDGFSRLLLFIEASDNNKASTVMDHFAKAVSQYGMPSRVRCDDGGENNSVCLFMDLMRGEGRGSAIRGKSVNNQRIERLWRDLWNGVSNIYHLLFTFMEKETILRPDNPSHIWALHYVYLPRINRDLTTFKLQWNHHKLRTENSQSPTQLFVSKMLSLKNSGLTAVKDIFSKKEFLQNPENSSLQSETGFDLIDRAQVHIPSVESPIKDSDLLSLRRTVNPLDDVKDYGIGLFQATVKFIEFVACNIAHGL